MNGDMSQKMIHELMHDFTPPPLLNMSSGRILNSFCLTTLLP